VSNGWKKQTPGHERGRASPWDAIGAPSAGLSLVGLLASRARLRFTRRGERTEAAAGNKTTSKQSQEIRFLVGSLDCCHSR